MTDYMESVSNALHAESTPVLSAALALAIESPTPENCRALGAAMRRRDEASVKVREAARLMRTFASW